MKSTVLGKVRFPPIAEPINAAYPIFLSLQPFAKLSVAVKLLLILS